MVKLVKFIPLNESGVDIKTLYASFENNKEINSNGETSGKRKPVILCSNYPFDMFSDDGELVSYYLIKFQTSLNQVYLDLDEFDLDEFGVPEEYHNQIYDEIDNLLFDEKYPISNLIKYKLNTSQDYSWYGCYVESISPNSIIETKSVTIE